MKHINTIINIVLGIAVMVLFVMYFNLKKDNTISVRSGDVKATDALLADTKLEEVDAILSKSKALNFPIAFVNVDTIAEKLTYFVNKRKAIEGEYKREFDKLVILDQQLKKDMARAQEEIENGTTKLVTTEDVQRKEMEFATRNQDILQKQQAIEMKTSESEQKLIVDINQSLDKFLKKYKDKLNYSYVFQKGGMSGSLLYANDSLDITKDVLTALNAEYNAKGKK